MNFGYATKWIIQIATLVKKIANVIFFVPIFRFLLSYIFHFFFFKEIIEISGFVIEMYGDSRINLKTYHY